MIHQVLDSRKWGQTSSFAQEPFSVCVTEQREVCVKTQATEQKRQIYPTKTSSLSLSRERPQILRRQDIYVKPW